MALANDEGTAFGGDRSPISGRETEVLRLIAEGHSSKEAAHHLCVSKRTVDFHLANVYEKLGVANRVHAIRVAAALGLLHAVPVVRSVRDLQAELELELVARRPDPT